MGDPITIGADKTIYIEQAKLEPPDRIYDADHAWIMHSPMRVSFVFAKKRLDNPSKLRTRLEIRYPAEGFARHFWKNSREFNTKLDAFVSEWPPLPQRSSLRLDAPADKDHSEWANFDCMAFAGSEGVIDFYQLSVPGIARFAKGQGSAGLRITAIVRVQLTAFELSHLLEKAGEAIQEVVLYLPKKEREKFEQQQREGVNP